MKKLYHSIIIIVCSLLSSSAVGQSCPSLSADFRIFESRCSATGAIKITVKGGSGSYRYKVSGPVNYNYTSTDSITGLSPGSYTIEINDVDRGCTLKKEDIVVTGDYQDPRFSLSTTNELCENGTSGIIFVSKMEHGRNPMNFSIVAPSPMGVGTTSPGGMFVNLAGGDYSIRLTDSCGGIQTRTISVQNYSWTIDGSDLKKVSCDQVTGWIRVKDSRGNTSTTTGIPGMEYGYLIAGSDIVWSDNPNFNFNVGPEVRNAKVFAKDACGKVKEVSAGFNFYPSLDDAVLISDKQCSDFTASVKGIKNFFSPRFYLYDNTGVQLASNDTGVFPNLLYGSYCIRATDLCADTTIERCFTVNALHPSIGSTVNITNKICSTFDASVTGKKDLIEPTFTLSKSGSYNPIESNATGIFTAIPYGDYCIYVTDKCGQFIEPVCFSVGQPLPGVPETIVPSYVNCSNFGLELHADSVYNPTYCLYDGAGKQIACNLTGIFDSIPLGSYCVTIHDACKDTTIERCFLVGPPEAVNDMNILVENQTCSTFTAHVNTSRLTGAIFSLYNSNDELVADNTIGIFENLPYGEYCVKTRPACPDILLTTCINVAPPVPSIGSTVDISKKTCTTFTAAVTNMSNLTDPKFFLADADGNELGVNNSTGIFDDLPYGDYCILVENGCIDATMKVCFTAAPDPFKLAVQVSASCNYGSTRLNISLDDYPGWVYVYNPSDVLVFSKYISSPEVVDDLPNLPDGQQYKVEAVSECSVSDIALVSPVVSWFRHNVDITQRCPGSIWPDGSGNINAVGITNTGNPTVRIIKKDGVLYPVPLQPDLVKFDTLFIFQDLGPGDYIIQYSTNDACKNVYYDTVTIKPYSFPNLDRSTAFQCDVNGFSVGAVVSDGIGPFTYEIISSNPSTPSILAGPQEDPVFTINNGSNYSLIRLRALDACGNATLGDASVLPLALSGIKVSENCIGLQTVLSVDEILNGDIKWYYQKSKADKDSTYLGDGYELIYDPLVEEKTGYYYAVIEMNNGCVARAYEYHLTGDCSFPLAQMQVEFTGRSEEGRSVLNWSIINGTDLQTIYVERKNGESYETIGKVDYSGVNYSGQYKFVDKSSGRDNYYRLRIISKDGKVTYSKIIHLGSEWAGAITIYPNPAKDVVTVRFDDGLQHPKSVELISMSGQTFLREADITNVQYQIQRKHSMSSGVYILKITDQVTGAATNLRVVFK